MPWADFPDARHAVGLLQQSLARGRLGHAYLLTGDDPDLLEGVARELAATLNCTGSGQIPDRIPSEGCGQCPACRRVRAEEHPDIHWVRAESKLRLIRVESIRDLIQAIQFKARDARVKVGILVAADRLTVQAANAFLKMLEEPPPASLFLLLSTEPDKILETILSRCLRLTFPSSGRVGAEESEWLAGMIAHLERPLRGALPRYRALDAFLQRLGELRAHVETDVEARGSRQSRDLEPEAREQWEEETKAAVEAEYRRRRQRALQALQWWLRDVWLVTEGREEDLLTYPHLAPSTRTVAARLRPHDAQSNLQIVEDTQAFLGTNVQEALALEVAFLRLHV